MANWSPRLKLRYDSYSNWTLYNPVLLEGEVAICTIPAGSGVVSIEPAILSKIGDGINRFTDLPWATAMAADVHDWAKSENPPAAEDIADLAPFIGSEVDKLKNIPNGITPLDEDGKVPASVLPSYVDDIIEGYLADGIFWADENHLEEIPPESGKIYVNLLDGKTYRWSGTQYTIVSDSIALGETAGTAYEGNKGKALAEKITSLEADSAETDQEISSIQKDVQSLQSQSILQSDVLILDGGTSAISNKGE